MRAIFFWRKFDLKEFGRKIELYFCWEEMRDKYSWEEIRDKEYIIDSPLSFQYNLSLEKWLLPLFSPQLVVSRLSSQQKYSPIFPSTFFLARILLQQKYSLLSFSPCHIYSAMQLDIAWADFPTDKSKHHRTDASVVHTDHYRGPLQPQSGWHNAVY